ncbi:DUF3422 domain-containing protein [Phaeovibrio sulfidiphilus]|uniref:DUF3422 domain-containing protein n=1 Tax=Phaeovibrio sulfidiphilus TaxID=1220600 RepID=A0A8J7CPM3_9PROT|nr:DUF3422 domain-containing protein [Phaeovibrio sulfidiphilus]
MSVFREHPQREALVRELHTRLADELEAPAQISSFAILTGARTSGAVSHIVNLCERMSLPLPSLNSNHFTMDLAGVTLRFEQHTEFCCYTLVRRSRTGQLPFSSMPLAALPVDWLASLPGELVSGVHIVLEDRNDPDYPMAEASLRHFDGNPIIGALVGGDVALVYTDLQLHDDRFHRILVRDIDQKPAQAGRLVQRLIEITHYRALSLLALPLARHASPILREIDYQLADIAKRMAETEASEDDALLLSQLSDVTAQVEAIATANSYRFGASKAYYQIVLDRLETLREKRIGEMVSLSVFLDRRLTPAMATCASIERRTRELSNRGARVASLLRARVEVDLQAQNKHLLESMDRRAMLQLRLQQAVEGLSVVAISYYMIGLLQYVLKAMQKAGLLGPVSDTVATGILVPLVFILVFLGLKRAKRALGLHKEKS